MIGVYFDVAFKRAFNKRIGNQKNLENKFWERLELFIKDPFNPQLKTHKLSGKLKGLHSFSIDYDCRVIFYFKPVVKAIIRTHQEVF